MSTCGGKENPRISRAMLFLKLFFEIDPHDLETSKFDEIVSKNLRALINIAEKERSSLPFKREFGPNVLKVIFS